MQCQTFVQILGKQAYSRLPKCAEFKNTCYVISEFYLKFNTKSSNKIIWHIILCIFEFIYSEKATTICQNLPVDLTFTKFTMEWYLFCWTWIYTLLNNYILSKRATKGKSLSEALILASINPKYDDRLFIEFRVQ